MEIIYHFFIVNEIFIRYNLKIIKWILGGEDKMKKIRIEKQIVFIFLLFTAFFTLFRSSMSGIFSLFYANNGIPDSSISSIKSFQSIGILIGLLPSGYLSDKVGRLKV